MYCMLRRVDCLFGTFKGCTARNVHGFTQDEVEKMAAKWEEAPSLYLQLDVKVNYCFPLGYRENIPPLSL